MAISDKAGKAKAKSPAKAKATAAAQPAPEPEPQGPGFYIDIGPDIADQRRGTISDAALRQDQPEA